MARALEELTLMKFVFLPILDFSKYGTVQLLRNLLCNNLIVKLYEYFYADRLSKAMDPTPSTDTEI